MMVLRKVISVAVLIKFTSPAFADWTWISDDMLITQGVSRYADRLEMMRADDCDGLRLRAWAKIGDKVGNNLKRGDVIQLDVRLADVKFLDQTKVLGIAYDFDEDFDVIYLDFGDWHWGVADIFSKNSDQSLTATFLTKNAIIDDNIWALDGFSGQVERLRDECKLKSLGVLV